MSRASLVAVLVVSLLTVPAFVAAIGDGVLPANAPPMPSATPPPGADVGGSWETPFEGQIPAVHVALLADGRVIYWSGDVAEKDFIYFLSTVEPSEVRTLAPPYDAATVANVTDANGNALTLFCSDHTILPNGDILSAGGSIWHATLAEQNPSFVDGTPSTHVFDWRNNTWTQVADMSVARWYPTVMTLSGGRALVASGIQHLPDPTTHDASMETFDGRAWTTVPGGDNILPLYPRLYEIPSGPMKGQIFYETGGTLWGPFGERPEEAKWNLEQAYDPATQQWRIVGPSIFGVRTSPDDIMLPLDPADGYHARLLNFAGTLQRSIVATPTSEITDFATDPPTHSIAAPLHTPRWQSTGVLLPDGHVLTVGGGIYDNVMTFGTPDPAVMTGEIYDPAANTWTETPPMTIPREYHGTAILLPDARVLVGGHVPNPVPWTAMRDNLPPANQSPQSKLEIYDPPYLSWNVTRPMIHAAPDAIAYGNTFDVEAMGDVSDAILIHNGAETHSSDPGQRAIVLPVEKREGNELTFRAPPDDIIAPEGPWMLFLRTHVDGKGEVPSIAKIVMLG